jgi:protocatechuate 3,4-dioxygenase beta subunit
VRVVSGRGGPPVAGIDAVLSTGAEARTDKGGIARFHMAYSTDMLRIRAKGYHPFEDRVPDADEELLVELKPGVALCGRVRLPDGKPAKGARAVCWDESSIREFDTPQIADGKGRFVIPAVDKAKPFRLVVSLDGFAPLEVRGVLLREGPELDLNFGGAGGLEGVVTPPAEVYVRAAHRKNPLLLDRGDDPEVARMETAHAHSDANGRYRIEGLAVPGAYVVCAGPNESAVVELSAERPRATVDVSSVAGPARSIRILGDHGKPLAKEWISLVGSSRWRHVETSSDGRIDLPPGEWSIDAFGYVVAPAAPEMRLDRGITLRGVVISADGNPAAEAWVSIAQPAGGRYHARGVTTDAEGRFGASGLLEGDAWVTAGEPQGADDGRMRIREGMELLRIEAQAPEVAAKPLGGTAALSGVVVDDSGRPVECARVLLAVGDPYEPTWTDEKGGFSVEVRPATSVVVQVGAPGFATRYVPIAKPGTEPVRLVLDPGALVRGRVVGADGTAVPGAYIVFWRRLESGRLSPHEDWKPETDSVGRFEIRLPPGTFHARYYDMGRSHARIPGPDVTVRGGDKIDLEIRLP